MNKSFYTKRDNDIKLFSKLPTLDNDSQSNSSSSSEDDYPKLIFDKRSSLKKHNKKRRHSLNKKVSFNSNKIVIDNQGKEKKQKTKFSTFQTKNIKSKMKSLELFEQNFDILIDEIEKDYKRKKRSKTAKISKKIPMNSEEKIISLTNMEMISDFYEYTENCMRLITELESKEKQKNKIPPRDFIFEDNLERKKIAIFDLDETLIHCVGDIRTKKNEEYQQKITVTMPTKTQVQIGINIRPHWKKSIREIKKKYYIVVYTASHNNYADAVLDFLDPENCIFEGRLYRKDCIQAQIDETKFYVKDLDIFKNFNLKDIVIIDNSVLSFAYHLNNGIPIVPYYNSKEDSELIILSKYLLFIADCHDLRKCNIEHICMESFLLQAQREKIEDSFKSDEENDSEKEKNNTNKENENKEDIKINNYKLREKTERKKTSNNKRDNLSMRRSKNLKLKTSVIKKRLSILSNNKNEYILDFNEENKNLAPKNFKRRNKTIRYKVQTMMNQIREKFENKIIFDK